MIGILGGGLTGLTLARHLKEESVVLEALPETGGLCRSITDKGFTFDVGGSHIIFSKDAEVLDFMTGVLGPNVVKSRRNTKILYKGRRVKYPFENGLSDLPLKDNLECLFSYIFNLILRKLGRIPESRNFKDCLYAVYGTGLTEKYLLPYNEKIWNCKAQDMNCEWVKDRLPMPKVLDLVKASLGIGSEGYVHQLFFYYPSTGGIQSLVKSVEKGVKSKVVTGFTVKSVKKVKGGFEVSDGKRKRVFPKLISTIPLPDLVEAIKDPVPASVRKAASALRFNSLVTVMLGMDQAKLNDISWMYIPSEADGEANRVSFPFNFSAKTSPSGTSSVLAEITCQAGDDVWCMKDGDVIEHVVSHLDRNKLIDASKVSYSRVARSKHAYVVYDLDHAKNKSAVASFMESYGIPLCGRFSQFEYHNMDKCIRSAMDKAKAFNA